MTDKPTKVTRTLEEWASRLTPQQFHVAREQGTERAFTGAYWDHHERGMYRCVGCEMALFESKDKFESGTGWPSFTRPAEDESVEAETKVRGVIRKILRSGALAIWRRSTKRMGATPTPSPCSSALSRS